MGINFIMIPMCSAGINIAATNGNVFAITGLVVLPGNQTVAERRTVSADHATV